MKTKVHACAGSLAVLMVATFWCSTVIAEVFLSTEAIVTTKRAILFGIAVLVPLLMITGGSGFALSGTRTGKIFTVKKRRMRLIAMNGMLLLAPSAFFLYWRAAAGQFDAAFVAVQSIELLAGAAQLVLLGLNVRDGLLLSGRVWPRRPRVSTAGLRSSPRSTP
jgi:hypothetical protein